MESNDNLPDLSAIPLFDTHEHLRPECERATQPHGGDALATLFSGYASTDLQTAGLSVGDLAFVRDASQPTEERWQRMQRQWQAMSNTTYARFLQIAARDLYNIDEISSSTIVQLDQRMRAASKPGLYAKVFQRANIRKAVVQDIDAGALPTIADPPDLLSMAIKGGPLLWPRGRAELELITSSLGVPFAHSLSQWLEVCEEVFRRADQAVALKLAHAYVCSLAHSRPTFADAEAVFNRIERRRELFGNDETLGWEESRPLRDYLVHHLIRLAIRFNLPIQIHTGLLENVFNDVRDAHPHHLIPLLIEYREARFVLFHGGYPWLREFIALGKAFPNVWLDLCWLWIISPHATRSLLHELIETIPANKLSVFGGDCVFLEGTYGHSVLARKNIAQVLQEKIQEGWFSEKSALSYAQAVMYETPAALYTRQS